MDAADARSGRATAQKFVRAQGNETTQHYVSDLVGVGSPSITHEPEYLEFYKEISHAMQRIQQVVL